MAAEATRATLDGKTPDGHGGRMDPIQPISLDDIEAARGRIANAAIRTPLVPLSTLGNEGTSDDSRSRDDSDHTDQVEESDHRIWLKLECLQSIGSFKIRGAANALALASAEELEQGVYTASAGNMAQGVAYAARRLGVGCRVIVPDTAPRTKVEAIRALGGTVVPLPFQEWWTVIMEHGHPDESGFFVHPVSDPAVIAGNGTVGLEILEAWDEDAAGGALEAVVVPYGGGGLSCGVASALAARAPDVPVFAAEVETAAPFAASLEAGKAVTVERTPSFVDGIGGSSVLEEMWPLAESLLAGALVEPLSSVCDAIRTLAGSAHVVAEGAGGAAVAAARSWAAETEGHVVAVVSGGNIDTETLVTILEGRVPGE
ncbi:MAG: pyridoxal-phosphate dependent enzyme [Longimicrobiales bacterium]|nr:pyridoxal-phosphate dependent enzyme [Longimicrobiales bacterium]